MKPTNLTLEEIEFLLVVLNKYTIFLPVEEEDLFNQVQKKLINVKQGEKT